MPGRARHAPGSGAVARRWTSAAALALSLAWWPAKSQADGPPTLDEPQFHTVGGPGAIPQDVVSTLAQDRAGFLWLGTSSGLVRYDGYRFRPVDRGSDDDKSRHANSFIRALTVARDGSLWFGTESDGLGRFDPATERITVFRHRDDAPDSIAAGTVRALAEDRDGALWIGTIGHGLDRLDPAGQRFEHFKVAPARAAADGALPDDRIQSLLVDRQGTLWVGTWNGLARRPAGSARFEPVLAGADGSPGLGGRIITKLFEARDGRIWIGTQQGDLAIFDPRSGKAWIDPGHGSSQRNSVYDLVHATEQQVWVGRATGIEVRDAGDGHLLRHLRHVPGQPLSLAGNEVRALLRDRAGWIWAGGYSGGLQRHDPGNTGIRVLRGQPGHGGVLEDPNVRSVLQLGNGEIWLGTQEDGVAILDRDLRLIGALRPDPRNPNGLGGGRIGSLAQAADGTVWLGSDSGLYQVRADRSVLKVHSAGAGRARRLLAARDGAMWIATQDGLFRHDPRDGRILRSTAEGDRPIKGDVNALVEAADGTLWIGTEAGLYVRPPGAQSLRPVTAPDGLGLAHPSVLGLLLDREQRLWIDTPAGLHRLVQWDGRQARFEHTAREHNLPRHAFGANLLEDPRGRLWTHLAVYNPANDRLHELTPADGVDIGTGWFRAYAQLDDGRMLFGGSKGLLVVRPEVFDIWSYAPPLVLSALRIDGQPVPAGQVAQGLTLQPHQHSVSFEFAALDYSDPTRTQYAWRLEGFDAQWTTTTADYRVASYSNLQPGRYTLKVRGTNRSGTYSPHELSIALQVMPPWWQTWWARTVMVALLGMLVLAVVHLRTALLRRQRLALEQKVRERTAELEAMSHALRRQSTALEEASLSDPLTGLRNRRFLAQHIEVDAALAFRHHEGPPGEPGTAGAAKADEPPAPPETDLVFFLVDLDHFKQINDEHGHSAGDAVLVQTGQRLRQVFRDADYLVRWGGEEFLIVARATARAHAQELAERARAMVADTPFTLPDGATLDASCSVGFAAFPLSLQHPRALNWSAVIDVADAALYTAKRAGRNRWVGVLEAVGGTPESLRWRAREPLSQWLASGELAVVRSP